MKIHFQNTYSQLPSPFFAPCRPTMVAHPKMLLFNDQLADDLGFLPSTESEKADFFSGNKLSQEMEPISLAYAGHQFGHFVPSLGDGRAILLGEVLNNKNQRFDLQLKGSGRTPFSRGGDGRAALGPMIREYIVSEAMHALGISSTRSLALVSTGEPVARETLLPGAIFTRVAASHLRVGTFEYFACRDDYKSLKILAEYAMNRHYPEAFEHKNPYVAFLRGVMDRQTTTIVDWMSKGFIHGVMNTDNFSISGETIDYGPCAFMDEYSSGKVFSSIDRNGRYAYNQQPAIGLWNYLMLCKSLAFLVNRDFTKSQNVISQLGSEFSDMIETKLKAKMALKIGIPSPEGQDVTLVNSLLEIMEQNALDFTLTFIYLKAQLADDSFKIEREFKDVESLNLWMATWRVRLHELKLAKEETLKIMSEQNPKIIPRNHRIAEAIEAATHQNDLSIAKKLLSALLRPYESEDLEFIEPPRIEQRVQKTFCGT
ncbi:MAG: YdiU family protein [Pseudomonadota bacterium]